MEFQDDEFYLTTSKILVLEQFCTSVVSLLCEKDQREQMRELSDPVNFKSIISRMWLLLFDLYTAQAANLYGFFTLRKIFLEECIMHKIKTEQFEKIIENQGRTQQKLWEAFKDSEDAVLMPEPVELSFKQRIEKILDCELVKYKERDLDSYCVVFLTRLAQMYS